ncbi:hypothetical protein OPQ81_007327 [Rhizoctonia solani]|nr:hypothetical protein OPQ81_007327 [Rhizoctonia solani]
MPSSPLGGPTQANSGSNAPGNSTAAANCAPPAEREGGPKKRDQPCKYFQRGSLSEPHPARNIRKPNSNFPGLSNDHFSKVVLNQTWGQTSSSLSKYVVDSFRFQTPDQVYHFLNLVCAASSQNSASWTQKDGQTHLHKLVQGNGIERFADAIRFPKETTRSWSFQRGYIPIFTYLSSDWVVKSQMRREANALYGLVHREFQTIRETVEANMNKLMAAGSFTESSQALRLSGMQVFKGIFVTISEYLTRYKEASITNPGVHDFTKQIVQWFDEWVLALRANPPFQDECTTYEEERREFMIDNLRRDKEQLLNKIRREHNVLVIHNQAQMSFETPEDAAPGLIAALERVFDYDGPGDLCMTGPRHDNDHAEIEMIQVAPTSDELLYEADRYLPANFFEAPHFYDPRSVERLLDIQFRLLREELTSPMCLAVQLIVEDLRKSKSGVSVLSQKLSGRAGLYIGPANARDSIRFGVFIGVTFQSLQLGRRGISAGIEFDTPTGKARSENPAVRAGFWQQVSQKRLMQDGLVALIWKTAKGKVDVYVGTVASSSFDLMGSSRKPAGRDRVSIRVSFLDEQANIRILKSIQSHRDNNDICVLIEAPVFYEGIRPFLEALKREPESLPFAQYLKLQPRNELSQIVINPPLYSRAPGFSFELKDLFPPAAGVESLRLVTRDPNSVASVRQKLIRASRLDPSQAEAVVDTLTREVALIQGPPGTGKSFTGSELIRVLIKNGLFPILLVALTNHALDHLLIKILDEEITNNIIRLGSRFEERLAPYSLDKVQRVQALESQMESLMDSITSHKVPSSYIEQHISDMYPHHYGELFHHIPSWIDTILPKPSDLEEGWEIAEESPHEESMIDFWMKSRDLQFLETGGPEGATAEATDQISSFNSFNGLLDLSDEPIPTASTRQRFLRDFMREHGLKHIPKVPNSNRPLGALQKDPKVWRMSQRERAALHKAWSIEASELTNDSRIQRFKELSASHKNASQVHKELTEQLKAEVLARAHIVGCTTTGAAKLVSMLSGMGPKVMIVEEAGQVLESHILASLVPTLEHVILIGDPKQLRPNINCYKMATENPMTGYIYKFDQSLMERLSSSGFPMSQINVQRRMRPEIASLIRKNTPYPELQDNERVQSYPNVRGMYTNTYFFSHTNKEAGGGVESVSKHNSFEVDMIYDLVVHLLKQGCYNKPGNIVVLAAYLGQIPKLRKKLEQVVTIVIDERDADLLEQHTMDQLEDEKNTIQEVQMSKQVTIRTLDNFQGEEGEVIILSLVRNSGTPFDEEEPSSLGHVKGKAPIGFLKSINRTNVGLSRAKHGLYIFGNAPELAQGSKMWSGVLEELHTSGCLGSKLPIACHRHPDYVEWVEKPGELPIVSPNGEGVVARAEKLSLAVTYAHLCATSTTQIIYQSSARNPVFDFAHFHTHVIDSAGSVQKARLIADSR